MARKSRAMPEINSGSMADVAFLLLIFYLVTTTISSDKGIAMLLPPKLDPNQPPPDITKNERNVFKILANSKNMLLVENKPMIHIHELRPMIKEFVLNFGNPSEEARKVYTSLPPSMKAFITQKGRKEHSSDGPDEAVVSFKADRGTSYELFIQILDEINGAYNDIYGERIGKSAQDFLRLDHKDLVQKKMYDIAREGIPRAISIAEPNNSGKK